MLLMGETLRVSAQFTISLSLCLNNAFQVVETQFTYILE